MKTKLTAVFCSTLALMVTGLIAAEDQNAAGETNAHQHKQQVQTTDAYVRQVENRLDQLNRKEVTLDASDVAKVTDEKWTKLHSYADGDKVVRLKVYPASGAKTEEFYYRDGQLVFAFIEPAGAGLKGHDANAKGSKYYFDGGQLIAVVENGTMAPMNEQASTMGGKLTRESQAFLDSAK
jgi:hypothetical protein